MLLLACPCNPNGTFSEELCDRISGTCACKDTAALPDCSQCVDGYYGDISNNIDCQKCSCPVVTNSHSSTCILDSNGGPICTNCEEGYTGERCQFCDNGYYGDPIVNYCFIM